MTIPWLDHATLIRTSAASIHEGGRAIVAEGPLHRLVGLAGTMGPDELERHYVALPDRRAPPFRYDGAALAMLAGRLDRPGALAFFAPPSAQRG